MRTRKALNDAEKELLTGTLGITRFIGPLSIYRKMLNEVLHLAWERNASLRERYLQEMIKKHGVPPGFRQTPPPPENVYSFFRRKMH